MKMKRTLIAVLVLALVLSIALTACGNGDDEAPPAAENGDGAFNVVSILNGNLGDRSFFDSAESGLVDLAARGIINYRTVELGGADADQPNWRAALIDVSESGNYDVVIVGTWQMTDFLYEIAPQFPEQMYIIYDSVVTEPNVLSLNYKQNDMGFVIGAFAALMTAEFDFPNINPDHQTIGFVGGEDGPVINDFLVGFIEGALWANPDVRVDTRYVASFVDPAGARELANAMIQQNGVDIIWGVAGLSGNGAAEAAYDNNVWFIGVDSDQEATFVGAQAGLANVTLTSGLKNVGESLIWAFEELAAGRTHWGEVIWLGLDLNGVGIVTDKNFTTTPEHVQERTLQALEDVTNGVISVGSAFGDDAVDVVALRESVRP